MSAVTRLSGGVLASLCLLGGLPAGAQESPELNWAQKMFDKLDLDFGVVARGADVSYRLKLRNLYHETIHITNVSTSCGCSAARPSANSIPSGQEAYIDVSMDTQRFMRDKTSAVLVTLSEPTKNARENVRIPLKVYIRTDVVFTPGSVNFGAVDLGAAAERKLTVAYAGRNDWKIVDVLSPEPYLEATAVETSRGGGGLVNYDLVVKLKSDAPMGLLRKQLTLVTDDTSNPHVPLQVEGRIEPDILVSPSTLVLGTVTPGQTKTVNLVVRGRKPFGIEKIEGTQPLNAFRVKLPTDNKQVHVLPFTFAPAADATPADIDEQFTITVPGRPEPVTFRATAKIAGN
jgi:hypothetical protein